MRYCSYGKTATVWRAEEVGVPNAEQAEQHGEIALEGRGAEVLVHLVKAVEQVVEIVRADGQHGCQANGRVHGVAAAHPIPKTEHVGCVDTELRNSLGVGGDGDKVLGDGRLVTAKTVHRPGACGLGIGDGFERGEGL